MARPRKIYCEAFKARVTLESIRGELTANQIASRHGVHPVLVNRWWKELISKAAMVFAPGQEAVSTKKAEDTEKLVGGLFEQIGRLKMEVEWLKKKLQTFD
jgi:putative transposase